MRRFQLQIILYSSEGKGDSEHEPPTDQIG